MQINRRALLRFGAAAAAARGIGYVANAHQVEAAGSPTNLTPDQALSKLVSGNARFMAGTPTSPNQTPAHRESLAGGQSPYAVILGCADSRTPPEIIFDAGLGDLFVVRVAGNAPNSALIASIEYAVAVLGAPLVMVLGHSSCGAVEAAVDSVLNGTALPSGHLEDLVVELAPAVLQVQQQPGDLADNAVTRNAQIAANRLRAEDPILASAVRAGTLKIVGARYELESGMVNLLPN